MYTQAKDSIKRLTELNLINENQDTFLVQLMSGKGFDFEKFEETSMLDWCVNFLRNYKILPSISNKHKIGEFYLAESELIDEMYKILISENPHINMVEKLRTMDEKNRRIYLENYINLNSKETRKYVQFSYLVFKISVLSDIYIINYGLEENTRVDIDLFIHNLLNYINDSGKIISVKNLEFEVEEFRRYLIDEIMYRVDDMFESENSKSEMKMYHIDIPLTQDEVEELDSMIDNFIKNRKVNKKSKIDIESDFQTEIEIESDNNFYPKVSEGLSLSDIKKELNPLDYNRDLELFSQIRNGNYKHNRFIIHFDMGIYILKVVFERYESGNWEFKTTYQTYKSLENNDTNYLEVNNTITKLKEILGDDIKRLRSWALISDLLDNEKEYIFEQIGQSNINQ